MGKKKNNVYVDLAKVKFYKRKNNTIQGYYNYKNEEGKSLRLAKYGKTEEEIIRKYKNEYNYYDSRLSDSINSPNANFRQLSLYWLSSVKRIEVKPSTLETLMRTYNNYIDRALGDKIINNIQLYELQQVINNVHNKGLSYSTVKKVKDFLCAIYKYALTIRIINYNPTLGLVLPQKEISSNPFSSEEKVFLKSDISLFEETAKRKNKDGNYTYKYGYIFLFMLNTGLRRGEMLALKWKDVDFEKKVLYVYKTVTYGFNDGKSELFLNETGQIVCTQKPEYFVQNSPKTPSSVRKIFLLPEAIHFLKLFKEKNYKGEDTYIVHSKNGSGYEPLSSSSFYHRFIVFKKASGVTGKTNVHSLRKTYATALYNSNVKLKSISSSMGHRSTQVTSDIYVNIANSDNYDNSFDSVDGVYGV